MESEITGLNENLIYRCATIHQAILSGYKINLYKFNDTAKELIKEYPWYYLPATVHQELSHGFSVIEHALVSIGELSEEATESNNKELKKMETLSKPKDVAYCNKHSHIEYSYFTVGPIYN